MAKLFKALKRGWPICRMERRHPTFRTVVRRCVFAGTQYSVWHAAHILETSATVFKLPRKDLSTGPGPSQNLAFNFLSKVFFLFFQVVALKRERERAGERKKERARDGERAREGESKRTHAPGPK